MGACTTQPLNVTWRLKIPWGLGSMVNDARNKGKVKLETGVGLTCQREIGNFMLR